MSIHDLLITAGFKRYQNNVIGKKLLQIESDSRNVSTYGPTNYVYKRGEKHIYWGLYEVGHSPKFFFPDFYDKETGVSFYPTDEKIKTMFNL